MANLHFYWDLDDDPDGNAEHIAEHGLTKEDVEHAMENAWRTGASHSSGLPLVFSSAPRLMGVRLSLSMSRLMTSPFIP
jgi:hypothetical protein